MERLLNVFEDRFVCKLVRSYRAHPALMNVCNFYIFVFDFYVCRYFVSYILQLYNTLFYKGELINCADPVEAASLLNWKALPNPSIPLMFIHSEEEEARDPDSPSWFNFAEKEIVMKTVKQLLDDPTLHLLASGIQ